MGSNRGSWVWYWLVCGCILLLPAVGCGYRRPPLNQVEAVVTLAGEPVAGADVMLVPTGRGRPIRGLANDSGRVIFSTYGSGDGVPAGTYRVVVSKLVLTEKASRRMTTLRSPGDAGADEPGEVMIEFQDGDYLHLLPKRYASHDTTDLSVTIAADTREFAIALEPDGPTADR